MRALCEVGRGKRKEAPALATCTAVVGRERRGWLLPQMGNPSGNVDAALLPYNRLPVVGTCHRVGVAGFTLHGGNGWASMWHGAAADFVQSLDVVVVG